MNDELKNHQLVETYEHLAYALAPPEKCLLKNTINLVIDLYMPILLCSGDWYMSSALLTVLY